MENPGGASGESKESPKGVAKETLLIATMILLVVVLVCIAWFLGRESALRMGGGNPVCPGPQCQVLPSPPDQLRCSADAKQCPDGSYVTRTAPNCEFAACSDGSGNGVPRGVPGPEPVPYTGGGTGTPSDPGLQPEPMPAPGSSGPSGIACTMEVKQCPDGSYVSRQSGLRCEFAPCPKGK